MILLHHNVCVAGYFLPPSALFHWVALIQLGKSYERMGRYEDALGAFTKSSATGGTTEAL